MAIAVQAGRPIRARRGASIRALSSAPKARSIQGEATLSVEQTLHNYDDKYLDCRGINHPWKLQGLFRRGSEIRRRLVCTRCKTERDDIWTPDGGRVANKYRYAEGYQLRGSGGIAQSDIRKEVIHRMTIYRSENQMIDALFGR